MPRREDIQAAAAEIRRKRAKKTPAKQREREILSPGVMTKPISARKAVLRGQTVPRKA